MKSFIFLFALLALVSAKFNLKGNTELGHGCTIPDGASQCCWVNSNGCCKPAPGQMCTMAITTCCKTKVVEPDGTVTYTYSHGYGNIGTDVM